MSDATDRVLFRHARPSGASAQQHRSNAEAARTYVEDVLRSDPRVLAEGARRFCVSVSVIGAMIAGERNNSKKSNGECHD